MLDKKVIQYTKDGIVQKDLVTGEQEQLTVSKHGKELHYSNRESIYQHHTSVFKPTQGQKRFVLRAPKRGETHYEMKPSTLPLTGPENSLFKNPALQSHLRRRAGKLQSAGLQQRQQAQLKNAEKSSAHDSNEAHAEPFSNGSSAKDRNAPNPPNQQPSYYGNAPFKSGASSKNMTYAKATIAARALKKMANSAQKQAQRSAGTPSDEESENVNAGLYASSQGISFAQSAVSSLVMRNLSKAQTARLGAASVARRSMKRGMAASASGAAKQAADGTKVAVKALERAAITAPSKSPLLIVVSFVLLLVIILMMLSSVFQIFSGGGSAVPLPAAVENYRPVVSAYAVEFGMSDYVDLILAVMAQESGGEGLDPMQASEGAYNTKFPKQPNGITDPQYSIWCGIQELKAALTQAGCTSPYDMEHIKLALQGYNYGPGFITWANHHGGYSEANALEFSNMMASKSGWSSYGDPQYVEHVLRYYAGTGGGIGYTDASFQNVKAIGESLLGTPYVLGGNTPGVAMDCSSFVCYVYTKSGKNMPRTTAQGIYDQYCTPISPSEAKAGDLIFFRDTYNCADTISHVGIYCGNGVMLEEGGSHVQYANTNSNYWQSHFYAYGRVK